MEHIIKMQQATYYAIVFKIGDKVIQKTGGPILTIEKIYPLNIDGSQFVRCTWNISTDTGGSWNIGPYFRLDELDKI